MKAIMARAPNARRWIMMSIAVIVLCLGTTIWAQGQEAGQEDGRQKSSTQRDTPAPEPSFAPESAGTDSSSQLALPADRIIEILQQQPGLLDKVRTVAAKRLQEQGLPVSEKDVTDDTLFAQIEQDEGLRNSLTQELRAGGYLSQADLESLGIVASETAQPRLRRGRPTKGITSTAESTRGQNQTETTRGQNQPETTRDQNQPETTGRPNPYPTLPALQDLYRQIPSQRGTLKRFGADIFLNGTGNAESLPMDLPAGPDYVLGPGDGLSINISGSVSQRLMRTVDREGRIDLPEAGSVVLAGYTLTDAQRLMDKALSAQFRDIHTVVSLTRLRTVRLYIVGDVERPGAYDISSLSTPLNALYAAGGPTPRGSLRTIRHFRGKQLVREVDLYDLLLRGVRVEGQRFEPGDTILVPPVGPQVTVSGMVRRPAIYELKGKTDLSDVLDLAGGVLVSATLRQINVERIEAHQRRVMLSVNMPQSDDRELLEKALGDFTAQDGDRVTISPILPYSEKTVYLQGHVFRPGRYPYHEGIQISDLIRTYQDVLPEPADHAEIIRLEPPDFRPHAIEFNLSEVLTGEDPIELKAFDMIRVFGRYEIDPPKVSIYGAVLRPGQYPLANKMTAADLVRLAGGFKRSAFQARADITSYVVQKGEKIRTEHKTVDIAKAISGESVADVVLKPGDVLTIHQLAGWSEIGASVTVNGQVMYPGTYGIEEGERLSTLLKRAGGFRREAYPQGAVLERVQVRELAEKSREELIKRIEIGGTSVKAGGAVSPQEQAAAMQAALQQREHILAVLRSQPASGRLVIKISPDIQRWEKTASDIELRPGDVVTIPKEPNFVLISGQVYNASAISYLPGKNAGWYLSQSGGPTEMANKKDIYIIRANGSVIGHENAGSGWWGGGILSTVLRPGDSIVVPEKIISGSTFWKTALTTAQFMSSVALTAGVIANF